MKKMISLMLVLAILVGFLPALRVEAATYDNFDTVMDVTHRTNLKEEPYAASETVNTLYSGDMVFTSGYKTNKYGNRWYVVLATNSEGQIVEAYAYSGDLATHSCSFQKAEDVPASFCRCGNIEVQKNGVTGIAGPGALAQPYYDMEAAFHILGAASTLMSGFGSFVTGVMNPYVLIPAAIAGAIFLVAVSYDGRTVTLEEIRADYKSYQKTDFDYGYYYPAVVDTETQTVAFMEVQMDRAEAKQFILTAIGAEQYYNLTFTSTRILLGNVYTIERSNATDLCDDLVKTSLFVRGNDKGPGPKSAVNKNKIPGNEYFRHFHLYFTNQWFLQNGLMPHLKGFLKVQGVHIFYGSPIQLGFAA